MYRILAENKESLRDIFIVVARLLMLLVALQVSGIGSLVANG